MQWSRSSGEECGPAVVGGIGIVVAVLWSGALIYAALEAGKREAA